MTLKHENLLLPGIERWPVDSRRPVIRLVDVHKSFGSTHVVRGLSLDVLPGLTTVVVGASGSGKSVLLKLILGLLKPDRGEVRLFGQDVSTLSEPDLTELRKRLSMLFQSYALFDSLTVEENVAFTLSENTRLKGEEIKRRVEHILSILGLEDDAAKLPAELSGGMKKRVSLARALVFNPEVVLFDEPTTGLDPIMIERVDAMILKIRREFSITALVISHDMTSTFRLADRIAVLSNGRIVAFGPPEEVRRQDDPVVKAFFAGANIGRLKRQAAVPASQQAATGVQERGTVGAPVVELVDVHKSFGRHQVLRGVSFKVLPRLITVIIGASGSGKSVIMKHVMGLLKADAGQVLVFGQDIGPMSESELIRVRSRFGMLFQSAALMDSLTVEANVAFPIVERLKVPRREARKRVEEILERLRIPELIDRFPGDISAGQRKRVGLARAIITQPEVVIYDEPTTGQDPVMTKQVDDMIAEAQQQFDITSIVISHDMPSTFRVAHRIAMLHEGRILAFGTPEELMSSSDEEVRKFIFAGSVSN